MVVKLLSAATLVAAASSANGAFETIGIDLGGALGSNGSPIPVVGGTLASFASGGNSADPFIHNLLSALPGAGIGMIAVKGSAPAPLTVGPAAPNAFLNWTGVENILDSATFPTANPAALQGVWLDNNIQNSGIHPVNGTDAAFYGQFGINGGGSWDLSNVNAKVVVREPGDANEQTVTATADAAGGPATANGFSYRLDMLFVGTDAFGTDVYQLWIEQVPTPGTAALLGVAGFAAVRRRRA